MGIEGSRKLHMWFMPGENPQVPKGKKDNTHYNVYGARVVAGALADAVAEQVPALKSHVCHYDYVVSAEGRGNFMDLEGCRCSSCRQEGCYPILGGEWKKPIIAKGKKIKFVSHLVLKSNSNRLFSKTL